jgi:HSP20 family molecular chaperone IbpA
MFYSVTTRPSRQSFKASAALDNAALQAFFESTYSNLKQDLKQDNPKPAEPDEKEGFFSLTLDVPGLTREQIDISVEVDVVRINSTADALRKFNTVYRFPVAIDVQSSHAKLENGVLSLSLSKQILSSKRVKLSII